MKSISRILIFMAALALYSTPAHAQGTAVGSRWDANNNLVYYRGDTGAAILTLAPTAITVAPVATFTLAPVLSTGTITVGAATVTVPAVTSTLVNLASNQTITGNKTFTGTVDLSGGTLVPAGGFIWSDGSTHSITVDVAGDCSASRTLHIPVLAGTDTIATLATAQAFAGVKTFSVAPVLSTATITSSGDTITIPDLGNAYLVQSAAAHTGTVASTAAQLDSYVVTVYMADAGTAGSVFVACPFAGTIKSIAIVNDVANTTTKTVFTAKIATAAVTLGSALEQGATDAAGTAHTVTCTANNAVTAGQALELITDGGSASASQATRISVVIQR